jgi:hypothetical protein
MKRILASMAVLGLMATPVLAATPAKTKPAAAQTQTKQTNNKKVAANTAKTKAKTNAKTNNSKTK